MAWITNLSSVEIEEDQASVDAPNATNTAAKLSRTGAANSFMYRENEAVLVEDKYYTFSIFAKVDDATHLNIRVGKGLDDYYVEALYNLEEGYIEEIFSQEDNTHITELDGVLTSVGDGWYSAQIGFKCVVAMNLDIYVSCRKSPGGIKTADQDADDANQDSSVYLWLPMLEKRRVESNSSYLGSAVFNVQSAPQRTHCYIPVYSPDTASVEYLDYKNELQSVEVTAPEKFDTTNAVEYVRIPKLVSHGFPTKYFVNDNQGDRYEYQLSREDIFEKYPPVRITFVNNKGALEDFWFTRKHEAMLDTKNDMYRHNTIDFDEMEYDVYGHSDKPFNKSGMKTIKVNTDFIDQKQNLFIEHLLMSEEVWLTFGQTVTPVNVKSKSMVYKTHVNEKLVQYELVFEYANRIDNKIR